MGREIQMPGAVGCRAAGKRRAESGQAMTEYVMLLILVAMVCIPVAKWLPAAVQGYVRPIYYCVSRPIP